MALPFNPSDVFNGINAVRILTGSKPKPENSSRVQDYDRLISRLDDLKNSMMEQQPKRSEVVLEPNPVEEYSDLPTTDETIQDLKRRLGKELYRIELDLQAGGRIADKPCRCLCEKHNLGIEATIEELIGLDKNPVYSEILRWFKDHEPQFCPTTSQPPEYYHSLTPEVRAFRKSVMGTETLRALLSPSVVAQVGRQAERVRQGEITQEEGISQLEEWQKKSQSQANPRVKPRTDFEKRYAVKSEYKGREIWHFPGRTHVYTIPKGILVGAGNQPSTDELNTYREIWAALKSPVGFISVDDFVILSGYEPERVYNHLVWLVKDQKAVGSVDRIGRAAFIRLTTDSPKLALPNAEAVALGEYIATVYTEKGYYYLGPDTDLKGLIRLAKEDIANNDIAVTHVYVYKFNTKTSMPNSDADPIWMWNREILTIPTPNAEAKMAEAIEETISVMARQNKKFGGRLEDIKIPISALGNIRADESGFTFVSKIPNLPEKLRAKYNMIHLPNIEERNRLLKQATPKAEATSEPWQMTREEWNVAQDIEEPSSYLYHGTPKSNLDSIRQRGLESKTRERNDWEEGDRTPQEQELLYFERKENISWGGKENIQLRINESMLPRGVDVTEDVLRPGEFYTSHVRNEAYDIPPEAIEYFDVKSKKWVPLVEDTHRETIKQALSEGKPVPSSVLADYPDLAKATYKMSGVPSKK